MKLVSDFVIEGVDGPTTPPIYPTLDGVALTDIHRFTAGQPWDDYARMREQAPVMWHEGMFGAGFWALTRYADVMRVNNDPKTFSSEKGGILMALGDPATRHPQLFSASMNTLINLDGSPHRQLRKEHMPYFSATYLRTLRARVGAEVDARLAAMAGPESNRGKCDFVGAFAVHLPIFTLCEMLGVPVEDRDKFIRWMHFLELAQNIAVQQAGGLGEMTPEIMAFIELFNANVAEMFAYGRDMLEKRRKEPQDDLMSAIAAAQIDGELLTPEYLDGSWLLIVFAGNDTTRNTLSGMMKLLTEFPGEKQRLLDDPALIGNAVHEVTRMVSPVIYMRRTATEDVEIGGQRIAEGEKVIMYYGAANRDAAIFPDPDRFDVARANAERHIAFGYGPHICIGRLVAQLQLEESYTRILARFPDIRWSGDLDIAPNNFVHAIRRLEVAFSG